MGGQQSGVANKSGVPSTESMTPPVILTLKNILKLNAVHKRSEHQAVLGRASDGITFTLKSKQPLTDMQDINGYVEIISQSEAEKMFEGEARRGGRQGEEHSNGQVVFEGEVRKGVRQGYGIEYSNGQVVYEGEFRDGVYHGWGVMKGYTGEFLNGKRSGWGIFQAEPQGQTGNKGTSAENLKKASQPLRKTSHESPIRYEGFWKEDQFHGIGALNVRESQIRDFMSEDQKPMPASSPYLKQYVGEWNMGHMNGAGKLITSKQVYTGDFVEDKYEGEGKLSFSDGKIVVGRFFKGKRA